MSLSDNPVLQASRAARTTQARLTAQETKAVKAAQDAAYAATLKQRPQASTPYGEVFTDTPAYAAYVESRRIHDWLVTLQADLCNLSLSKAEAVARIVDFQSSLTPAQGTYKTEYGPLEMLRKALDGNTAINVSSALRGLSFAIEHAHQAASFQAQDMERIPDPTAPRYTGPFFKVAPAVNQNQLEIDKARAAVEARR